MKVRKKKKSTIVTHTTYEEKRASGADIKFKFTGLASSCSQGIGSF